MSNIKVSSDMIRPFTGEGELVAWLKKVKLVAKLQKISDLACFLPLYLEGAALAIYLEMKESDQADAEKIEARLKEAFTDGPFVAHRKLVQMRWTGEQVDVYANEIRRLAGLAGFTGENLERMVKLTFVNGFPDNISVELQQVEKITTLSMSDILTRARILCVNKDSKVVAVAANMTHRPSQKTIGVEHTGARAGEAAVPARRFKGQCYNCGGPHMARFCKERKGVVCYRCGTEGHIAPQCSQNQGNDKRGAVAPAATPSME